MLSNIVESFCQRNCYSLMETSRYMRQDALQDTHLFLLGLLNDPNDGSFWTRNETALHILFGCGRV